MAEATNDLLLQVMRQVQGDLAEIRKDIAGIRGEIGEIRTDLKHVDQKVDGLAVMMVMLAGHVHHVEQRVEVLEKAQS